MSPTDSGPCDDRFQDHTLTGRAWGFLGWLIGVFVLWLIVGFQWFPADHELHAAATVPTAVSVPAETTGPH